MLVIWPGGGMINGQLHVKSLLWSWMLFLCWTAVYPAENKAFQTHLSHCDNLIRMYNRKIELFGKHGCILTGNNGVNKSNEVFVPFKPNRTRVPLLCRLAHNQLHWIEPNLQFSSGKPVFICCFILIWVLWKKNGVENGLQSYSKSTIWQHVVLTGMTSMLF